VLQLARDTFWLVIGFHARAISVKNCGVVDYTNSWTDLAGFATDFRPILYCVIKKFGYFLPEICQTLDLDFLSRLLDCWNVCCHLISTKVDAYCAKPVTVVGRTKLTILAKVDVRPMTDGVGQFVTLSIHLCLQHMRVRQRVARVHLR